MFSSEILYSFSTLWTHFPFILNVSNEMRTAAERYASQSYKRCLAVGPRQTIITIYIDFFHTGVDAPEITEMFSAWRSTPLPLLSPFLKMLLLIFFSIFSRTHMKSLLKSPIKCPLTVKSRIIIDICNGLVGIKQETAGIV